MGVIAEGGRDISPNDLVARTKSKPAAEQIRNWEQAYTSASKIGSSSIENPRQADLAAGTARSSGIENPRQADLVESAPIRDHIAAEAADARVVAAGDNYDQAHIINPRTGNEYTDSEARLAQRNNQDSFRQELPPERQIEYDAWLSEVEDNPAIVFDVDPALDPVADRQEIERNKDLVYRGLATATFGDQAVLDELFDRDSPYTIEFSADPVKTAAGTTVGAIAHADRIEIQYNEASDRLDAGDRRNVFTHEFVHVLQRGNPVPPSADNAVAETAELQRIFIEARDRSTPQGEQLADLIDPTYPATESEPRGLVRWLEDDTVNQEPYAVAAGYFFHSPADLQKASPDLYDLMVRTTGVDPLAGSSSDRASSGSDSPPAIPGIPF